MSISRNLFSQHLLASGLMTADELRDFCATLKPNEAVHKDAESLTRALLRSGKLTAYQVERLLDGKPEGLVLGNNVILEPLGSGGMGEVFRAEHRRMKRPVVVKMLHSELTESETALKRFQREVEAAAQLSHPNIVTAFDADEANGIHFLVMEYVDGPDLGTLAAKQGPLAVERVLDYLIQAARGIAYAHERGIIHRDIKPGNLLVDTGGVVKVLDMGLARFDRPFAKLDVALGDDEEDSITKANQIVGTVDYMSPEQADSSAQIDRRSDIYSLGCTLYRLLTGKPPFPADSTIKKLLAHRSEPIPSLRTARPDVPEAVDWAFQKMLAKRPEDRFATMEHAIAELLRCQAVLRGEPLPDPFSRQANVDVSSVGGTPAGDATRQVQIGEETHAAMRRATGLVRTTMAPRAVGIDLGTTFSAVAYLDDLGRPTTVVNAEGDKITPSVVFFDGEEVIVGKESIKAMSTDMECVAECAKRDLGLQHFHRAMLGSSLPPEALGAWILNKLRIDAWKSIGRFDRVVITVPAYFDEVRRKATQDAGYMAGFDVMDIINEPTAAALAYGFQEGFWQGEGSDDTRRILVYDLGGGTFDVSVMEICGNRFATLATDGDVRLGGRDWDQRLVDLVAEHFVRAHGRDPRSDPNTLGRLLRECEEGKRTLSVRNKTIIPCDFQGFSERVEIKRREFEQMTQDLLDRTTFTVRQTIRAAGLNWKDLDRVLLVGGSTRMPSVREMLRELTGLEPDTSVSPDEAVCHGAALHAGLLWDQMHGRKESFSIRNVNSHSLGIAAVDRETKRRQTAVVIPRNTPLPVTAKRVFTTSKDGQRSILVQIVEGESDTPDDCVQIGRCTVRDLPSDLPAKTPVEVRFRYESNGRLGVEVHVQGIEAPLRYEIARENTLSLVQLDQWRQRISGLPPIEPLSVSESKSTELMSSNSSDP